MPHEHVHLLGDLYITNTIGSLPWNFVVAQWSLSTNALSIQINFGAKMTVTFPGTVNDKSLHRIILGRSGTIFLNSDIAGHGTGPLVSVSVSGTRYSIRWLGGYREYGGRICLAGPIEVW